MSTNSIIQEFYEIENKLESLRDAVYNKLECDSSQQIESEFPVENNELYLDFVFNNIRSIWNIPENISTHVPITDIQKEMSKNLPKNWASRQIIKLREE